MAAPVAIQLAGAMEIAGGVSRSPTSPVSPTSLVGGFRTPSPFVNLNVRDVFETHGLDHTKEISKKVNVEIEKKKEELRTLVGERYRDLIDAADTIASMSSSSAAIFKKLGNLRQQMSALPTLSAAPKSNLQVSGSPRIDSALNKGELEIAFELKLSLEAPRVIQKCLDEMNVVAATHISLLFDKNLCQSNRPYQWAFLYSTGKDPNEMKLTIKNLILKACDDMMEDFMTPPQKLAECVAAKQVLTNSSNNEVISELLSKRIEMSKLNLLHPSLPKEIFVQNIARTLQDVYVIFIDGQLYNSAVKDMRRPKISTNVFGIKYTPKSVENFKNAVISVEDPPRASQLAQLFLNKYVEPLKLLLSQCFDDQQYLVQQQSFKELQEYQKETLEILKGKIEDLMRIVLGTSKSLWSEAFYPVFQKKCEQVGKLKLDVIFQYLDDEGFPKFEKLDEEFNLVDYIWRASSSSSKGRNKKTKATYVTAFSSNKDVDLKLKCIPPQVADICGEVEQRFIEFLKDFNTLGDFSQKKAISSKILENWEGFLKERSKSPDRKSVV